MKTTNTEAAKAQGAEAIKNKSKEALNSVALLIFSMIGVSTVLQLVFLA